MEIGNVKIEGCACLAPLAGVADRAFRELCRDFGAAYTVSEMVSAKGVSYKSERSTELMELTHRERPAAVQLFGCEPETIAYAAKTAMRYLPEFIDINMGCPAPKIVSGGNGSALMKQPKLCARLVRAAKESVPVPIAVKIRKGWETGASTRSRLQNTAKRRERPQSPSMAVHASSSMLGRPTGKLSKR